MGVTLRRYTDVLSLLDMLKHNRLTLLPPSRWYDENDRLGLSEYGARRGKGAVFALCMAEGKEQAHHWQLFAGHSHGVSIQFEKSDFVTHLDSLQASPRFGGTLLHGPVIYQNLSQIRDRRPIRLEDLPFLKRETFSAEEEYRLVGWQDDFFAGLSFTIPLPATLIKRVTLGPAMPQALAETLKDIACEHEGCRDIPFGISRMVNNASWAEALAAGLPPHP